MFYRPHFYLLLSLHLFQAASFETAALQAPGSILSKRPHQGTTRAIKRTADLRKRDEYDALIPSSDPLSLDYVKEHTLDEGKPFVATVRITPIVPALALEHIDEMIEEIQCTKQGIALKFHSKEIADHAKAAWQLDEFIVVTSHKTCNADGARLTYRVTHVEHVDEWNAALLEAHIIQWKAAGTSMNVDFGTRDSTDGLDLASYQPSPQLRKRDWSRTGNLSFSHINRDFLDFSAFIWIICTRCVGYGTVTLRGGSLSMPTMTKDVAATFANTSHENAALRPSVLVDLRFHNFSASMEIQMWVNLYKIFDWSLLGGGIPIAGIDIPEILQLGLFIDLMIVVRYMAYSPLKFFFGFNFTVEDGAGATVDLTRRKRPEIDFFRRTKHHISPMRISYVPVLGINQTTSFRPAVRFGLEVLRAKLDEVELFIDVPRWILSISLRKNLNDQCASTNSTAKGQPLHILVMSIIQIDTVFGILFSVFGFPIAPNGFLTVIPLTTTQTCFGPYGGTATTPPRLPGPATPTAGPTAVRSAGHVAGPVLNVVPTSGTVATASLVTLAFAPPTPTPTPAFISGRRARRGVTGGRALPHLQPTGLT